MIDLYDQMTALTTSKDIEDIVSRRDCFYYKFSLRCTQLSVAKVDNSVSDIRSELCDTNGDPNYQSNETNILSSEDIKFISSQLSALLHAVKGARRCNDAKWHGVHEANRRHEWDALLLNFFQPSTDKRDVLCVVLMSG
jgi:hypothetical protein